MSTTSINNLANSDLQSILNGALQNASTVNNSGGVGASSSLAQQTDNSQLSPLGQVLSTLQQLQQSDPAEYQQVTQQIATNLQSAAQTAQTDGNTTEANQLNQLATDFTSASKTGQLPNIQDLAQAAGGHHHHHHRVESSSTDASSSDSNSTSASTSSSSSSAASQTASQLFSSYQENGTQNDALNPLSIISNTLSAAGIQLSDA